MKNIFTTVIRIVPVLFVVFFLVPGNAQAATKWYYQGQSMEGPPIPFNLCSPSDPAGLACTVTGSTATDNCKTQFIPPPTWPLGLWYNTYRCEVQSGTINVNSNIPTTWSITGASSALQTSLIASTTYTAMPTGSYTINWGTRSGYATPPAETINLNNFGNITFSGSYVVSSACTVQDSISGMIHTFNEGEPDFVDFWNTFSNPSIEFTACGFACSLRYRACGVGGTGCGTFGEWSASPATRRPTVPATCTAFAPKCSNGIDDDADGLIDTNDPQCHSDGNAGNAASFTPTVNSEGAAPSVNLNFI